MTSKALLCTLVLSSTSALATPAPVGQRGVQVGRAIVHEEPGVASGMYVLPNESRPYVFNSILKSRAKSGSLLSIGTFRSVMNSARMRNPSSPTFMLDYDRTTTEFNLALVEALDHAENRHAFLARLFGVSPSEAPAPGAASHHKSGYAVDMDYLKALEQIRQSRADEARSARPTTPGSPLELMFPQHGPRLDPRTEIARTAMHWQRSIFGSDALFAIAKRQAQRGVFVPLNGSIVGDRTIPELGKALEQEEKRVSVVDLSNTLEYEMGRAPIAKVASNLRALPLSEDAVVLFTSQAETSRTKRFTRSYVRRDRPGPGELRSEDIGAPWDYYAIPARELLRAEALGLFRAKGERSEQQRYNAFLELAIKHSTAGEQAELVSTGASFAAAIEEAAHAPETLTEPDASRGPRGWFIRAAAPR